MTDRTPIVVKVPASIYTGSYVLTWDFDNYTWVRTEGDEPAIGPEKFNAMRRQECLRYLGLIEEDLEFLYAKRNRLSEASY